MSWQDRDEIILELRAEVERLKTWQAQTTEQMLYIAGIVERGEGRPLLDGERIPQAILRYVQSLESRLATVSEALQALVIVNGREIGYRTMHGIPMQMAKSIEKKVRAGLAAVQPKASE